MTFTLTALRDDVEADLRDDTNLTWSTAQVDRAITAALDEYTRTWPVEKTATLTLTGRSADLSAAAPAGLGSSEWAALVRVLSAEYPVDRYPPEFVRTSLHGSVLYLQTDTELAAASVRLWYTRTHTVDGSGGTVPDRDRALLARGAAGFALDQRATALAADGLAIVGRDAVANLRELARTRLDEFQHRLAYGRGIRARRLYRAEEQTLHTDIVQPPPG